MKCHACISGGDPDCEGCPEDAIWLVTFERGAAFGYCDYHVQFYHGRSWVQTIERMAA